MIGLDTNVLTRYIAQDDPLQSSRADAIVESLTVGEPGWVSIATLLEVVWVLKSTMRVGRERIGRIISQFLTLDQFVVEQSILVEGALRQYEKGNADFADYLIAASAQAAGCSRTVTFDRIAARDAGMELIG